MNDCFSLNYYQLNHTEYGDNGKEVDNAIKVRPNEMYNSVNKDNVTVPPYNLHSPPPVPPVALMAVSHLNVSIDVHTVRDIVRHADRLQGDTHASKARDYAQKIFDVDGEISSVQVLKDMLVSVRKSYGNDQYPSSYFQLIDLLTSIIEA